MLPLGHFPLPTKRKISSIQILGDFNAGIIDVTGTSRDFSPRVGEGGALQAAEKPLQPVILSAAKNLSSL
jgi:hypothetical protein